MDILNKTLTLLGVDEVLKMIKVLSPYGAQAKRDMGAYGPRDREALMADLDLLDVFVAAQKQQSQVFSNLRRNLSHLKEVGESLENAVQGLALTQVELFEIKGLLIVLKRVQGDYGTFLSRLPGHLQIQFPCKSDGALDPGGDGLESFYIGDDYSAELAAVRQALKQEEIALRGLRLEVARALIADYPGLKFRPNGTALLPRGQAQASGLQMDPRVYLCDEHYETVAYGIVSNEAMAAVEREIEALKWREEQAIYDVRLELSGTIASEIEAFRWSLTAMGWLDLYVAKAALAIGVNGTRPVLLGSGAGISIEGGRHIGVEQRLRRENKGYTPVSVRFDTPVALITGANMGGKTIALKMIGQVVALAHFGLYVPAESASFPMLHYIVAAIGDEQSMDRGLSTFGAEIVALKDALNQADREGLILVDELARGTNPREGAALSKSIVSFLCDKPSYAVITTHFDGLAENGAVRHWQVRGLKGMDLDFDGGDALDMGNDFDLASLMDYRLEPVSGLCEVPREALHIARLMGLPQPVIEKAHSFLK